MSKVPTSISCVHSLDRIASTFHCNSSTSIPYVYIFSGQTGRSNLEGRHLTDTKVVNVKGRKTLTVAVRAGGEGYITHRQISVHTQVATLSGPGQRHQTNSKSPAISSLRTCTALHQLPEPLSSPPPPFRPAVLRRLVAVASPLRLRCAHLPGPPSTISTAKENPQPRRPWPTRVSTIANPCFWCPLLLFSLQNSHWSCASRRHPLENLHKLESYLARTKRGTRKNRANTTSGASRFQAQTVLRPLQSSTTSSLLLLPCSTLRIAATNIDRVPIQSVCSTTTHACPDFSNPIPELLFELHCLILCPFHASLGLKDILCPPPHPAAWTATGLPTSHGCLTVR
ncbi:hypothetical protein CABS01_09023 [Colletotrichum abscissum]|uniref:uncharacterized protein n=1 Tax=Colletotrichum abscissum TaxID=1671311 RepID=UPI0027D71248|nr:uncharacterized protein CABS01_09023 [Colletotrichum abscissum]KAK1503634.1 hypothetical protein CABS01_09023 [Colletotrichum abscissum]